MTMNLRAASLFVALVFLLLIPLGPVGRAAAAAPVTGRLDQAGSVPLVKSHHRTVKPFFHARGKDSLTLSKKNAAMLSPLAPVLATAPPALPPAVAVTAFDGVDQTSSFADPPDGAIAVSSTYIVEAVNTVMSVWAKSYDASGQLSAVNNVVDSADLDSFLGQNSDCYAGSNRLYGLVSDPSVDYDRVHDRFMVSAISFDQLEVISSLCIAVTTSGDPTGDWFIYAFPISPPTSSLFDFPRSVIGSDGIIYLTGNLFRFDFFGNATFQHARAYAFNTADMYAGIDPTPRFQVVGNDPETGTPADTLTAARGVGVAGMYFVSATNPEEPLTGSTITLWKWTNPFGSNVFTQQGHVTVSPYTIPPPAIQPDALPPGVPDCQDPDAACIETNDARNLGAFWFGNTVWATHSAGCTQGGTPVSCVQWYQLGNLDGSPTLLRQGIVDNTTNPGRYRYYPSLAVDQNGNVVLAYAYSSASEYPGVAYSTIGPSGQVGPETVLKAGETQFVSTRYGDFAGTALDPHDNLTIWHIEEYSKDFAGFSVWGTWISAIQVGGTVRPPVLAVTPASQDFGTVNPGSTAERTFTVQNTGGGTLTGTVTTDPPFSILTGGSFTLGLGVSKTVTVRFAPTASGTFSANVSFTSDGGNASRPVTGAATGVSSIAPSAIDLVAPPANFTLTGIGFANLGFGLPVANFTRNGVVLAQARATSMTGNTILVVPFPTPATAIAAGLPGLSAGPVQVQVYLQTSASSWSLFSSIALTVTDTRPAASVDAIAPNPIDLATSPATFTITGNGFANLGFGLPVVNFARNGVVLAQARATGLTGSTLLTVPFPTAATAIASGLPGLSAGPVQVEVYPQTGPATWTLLGTVALTVNDTRGSGGGTGPASITPSSIDLASPPVTFSIAGNGFANQGFGLPVVNFTRNGVVLAQARATALSGSTTLTVPFPTFATALVAGLPGLSAGSVDVQVYNQTSGASWSLLSGSVALTVTDTRSSGPPGVSSIAPNSIDLATPPATFTITGNGFTNIGFGFPVVNFMRNGVALAQARATALSGNTSLTVPFPTAATAIASGLPGLSAGPVQVDVYNQTSGGSWSLVGSIALTVSDTRGSGGGPGITPSSVDLASPPASFTIVGSGFSDLGFGLPVANFARNGVVLAQARATALSGSTSLTVPFPTAATALASGLPGLSAGPVQVDVYNQTSGGSFNLAFTTSLTVTDSRSSTSPITPSTIDLASPPASFTIVGTGFANLGFGLPVVNFMRNGVALGQARATALTGSTTLTVPFPTAATALVSGLPGLSAGAVQIDVYNQTSGGSFNLVFTTSLTVTDTR